MLIKAALVLAIFYITGTEGAERNGYKYYPEIQGLLKLYTEPADWQTARMNCHDEDAILAAPSNEHVWHSILQKVLESDSEEENNLPISAVYAGVIEQHPEGIYKYEDGQQVLSLDSNDVETLDRCVAYRVTGSITRELVDCRQRFAYICHAPTPYNVSCGTPEYELDKRTGHCYKFHAQSEVWNDAHRICQEEGAHLAIINSNTEARVLMDLFEQYPFERLNGTNVAWGVLAVGFYYWKEADTYITIQGQTLEQAGYAEWSYGNPSSRHKSLELGGGMFRSGLLDDLNKSYKVPFICERKPIQLIAKQLNLPIGSN